MLKNVLITSVIVLSCDMYAQDSLLVEKTNIQDVESVANMNNIRYINLDKSYCSYSTNRSIIEIYKDIPPSYMNGVLIDNLWSRNWFVSLGAGPSSFLGEPLGCEDLFGRIEPSFQLSIGKWFTPNVGARVIYQGGWMKNSLIQKQNYHSVHADLLWDIITQIRGYEPDNRWSLIPFIGCGIIYNQQTEQRPFAMNYGILNKFVLNKKLSLILELGGTTTFGDFDGAGNKAKFGDNILHLTAGLSLTIGSKGWRRVIDAQPYIDRNAQLMASNQELIHRNSDYRNIHEQDIRTINEMKKIFEIEGIIDRYTDIFDQKKAEDLDFFKDSNYPKNDYNGLNSLRERLLSLGSHTGNASIDINGLGEKLMDNDTVPRENPNIYNADDFHYGKDYLNLLFSGKECIGSPIMFFFMVDTDQLTDSSQLANVDEIVRICKKYDLLLRVIGSADSATGDVIRNQNLSMRRSDYITDEIVKRGIPQNRITKVCKGGVNDYQPIQINRCAKVELFFDPALLARNTMDKTSNK